MPADGNIVALRRAASLRVVESAATGSYGFGETGAERFTLRPWANGYAIYDRGDLICTFHGPQFGLAGKTLKLLRADAARHPPTSAA